MTDHGMPPRGFLYVVYYSGGGEKLHGTSPDIPVRKSMLNLVGITEQDLFRDDSNVIKQKTVVQTSHGPKEVMKIVDMIYDTPEGKKSAMNHRNLWEVYLAPSTSTSARIARGEKIMSVFGEVRAKTGKDPFNLHVVSLVKFQRKNAANEEEPVGGGDSSGKILVRKRISSVV